MGKCGVIYAHWRGVFFYRMSGLMGSISLLPMASLDRPVGVPPTGRVERWGCVLP